MNHAIKNPVNTCPYWVGNVFISFAEVEPSARWPGTSWERITDCFLRAADDKHPAGMTGGAWEHEITIGETPVMSWYIGYGINQTTGSPQRRFPKWAWYFERSALKQATEEKTMLAATPANLRDSKQQAMDITNKYTAANMWRRTA